MKLTDYAQKSDVEYLARFFAERLPQEADKVALNHTYPEGNGPWTKAIWNCFEALRQQLGEGWTLYPEEAGKGLGRAKGEYLVDFFLTDETLGLRIACESEFWTKERQDTAFDKLRGVKSDIKIFIFEMDFTETGEIPSPLAQMVKDYLAQDGHFLPPEHFLLLQLSTNRTRGFHWEATHRGPYKADEIEFTRLDLEANQ